VTTVVTVTSTLPAATKPQVRRPSLTVYLRRIDSLLAQSIVVRKQLASFGSQVSSGNYSGAEQTLRFVINARRRFLTVVSHLVKPGTAVASNNMLTLAFAASLRADLDYLSWLQAKRAGDSSTASAALSAAQLRDREATLLKTAFLRLYNNLRGRAGVAPLPANLAF
jgi:hypothetical protein